MNLTPSPEGMGSLFPLRFGEVVYNMKLLENLEKTP